MASDPLASLVVNDAMIQTILRDDPLIRAKLEEMGHQGVAYGKSISPIGSSPKDKHPGAYRDSWYWEIHKTKTRQMLRVGVRDQKAWWIEYGAQRMPKFAPVRRVFAYLSGKGDSGAGSHGSEKGSR